MKERKGRHHYNGGLPTSRQIDHLERHGILHYCEASDHAPGCNGFGNTEDHFTPKCIGKAWHRQPKTINCAENYQYLSRPCHDVKDLDTPLRAAVLKKQLKGKVISFEQHIAIFLGPEYVLKYRRLMAATPH